MDCETNIDSIRALEEQIREHERAIVQLKRTRNSLLNVSKLPPEVLGDIFHRNVTLKGDFDGLDDRSHNFLLVCHHWFEVALQTPEIWSFWGNTPKDWARLCRRSGTTPLDLVLKHAGGRHFDTTMRNILQDRATRDTIRRIHLTTKDSELLSSMITSLTSDSEELRSNSIESFILWNYGDIPVDVSGFFAHHHFPKLRRLELFTCTIPLLLWDRLSSRTPVLTTLVLHSLSPSSIPTTSQLLLILASNPALQKITFIGSVVPDDDGSRPSFRVQLRHLKELRLQGHLRYVIRLLHQLDYPRNIDELHLTPCGCDVVDISRTIGPYLQDHLQRHNRPRNGLSLFVTRGSNVDDMWEITLYVGDARGINFSAPEWTNTFVTITVVLNGALGVDVVKRATLDLITHVPREEVVYFQTYDNPIAMEDTYTQFPNVRALSLCTIPLSKAFPKSTTVGDGRIFPSLEHVLLKNTFASEGDWSPLMTFLARRVSSGNRLDTLTITNSSVCPEVMEGIRGMVRELKRKGLITCPFYRF